MCNNQRFFICKHCGNFIGAIKYSGAKMICCGQPMSELVPNTEEAATEKHIPVVSVADNMVTVTIGSVIHPMTDVHYIDWIYIQTKQGVQRKCLAIDGEPTTTFALTDGDEVVSAYAYCNLHGLWKIDL